MTAPKILLRFTDICSKVSVYRPDYFKLKDKFSYMSLLLDRSLQDSSEIIMRKYEKYLWFIINLIFNIKILLLWQEQIVIRDDYQGFIHTYIQGKCRFWVASYWNEEMETRRVFTADKGCPALRSSCGSYPPAPSRSWNCRVKLSEGPGPAMAWSINLRD